MNDAVKMMLLRRLVSGVKIMAADGVEACELSRAISFIFLRHLWPLVRTPRRRVSTDRNESVLFAVIPQHRPLEL